MGDSKKKSKKIETVDYEDFLQDPTEALSLSASANVSIVDKTGKRRAFVGQVKIRDTDRSND